MTGSYNNFFRIFDCNTKKDITLEASKDNIKPRGLLKPKKVSGEIVSGITGAF